MPSHRLCAIGARRSLAVVPSLLGAGAAMWLTPAAAAAVPVGTGPHASPPAPALPIAVDHAFAGEIELHVDATDVDHGIFRVRERIPVQQPGDVVLLYPEWETASHAPTASAIGLAGLVVSVDGRRVAWRRDDVNMHAFHVTVPAGAYRVDLSFDYLSPTSAARLRPGMTDVEWHRMLLYPAGWYARNIPVAATLQPCTLARHPDVRRPALIAACAMVVAVQPAAAFDAAPVRQVRDIDQTASDHRFDKSTSRLVSRQIATTLATTYR